MTQRALTIAINKVLRDESRYATGLEKAGDFDRAKLARAAIEEIRCAQRQAATADEATFDTALRDALHERRAEYNEYWDDPSGVGSSTFTRVLDLI